jgi:hypothetical protein
VEVAVVEKLRDPVEVKYSFGEWHIFCWETTSCKKVLETLLEWGVTYELDNCSNAFHFLDERFAVRIIPKKFMGGTTEIDDLTQWERERFFREVKNAKF